MDQLVHLMVFALAKPMWLENNVTNVKMDTKITLCVMNVTQTSMDTLIVPLVVAMKLEVQVSIVIKQLAYVIAKRKL